MHIAGIVFVLIGLGLIFLAMRARTQAAGRVPVRRDTEASASLAAMNKVMPSIVNFGLVVAGAQITFFYFAMGVGNRFSLVDLGGFLFLLACYGVSVTLRTRLRQLTVS